MGDRAHVKVVDFGQAVCLYTHWAGSELPETLRAALARGRGRWGDAPYLTRIIFCEMVRGEELEETGFGISSSCGDGEDRVLTVNCVAKTVSTCGGAPVSFAEYIKSEPKW